MEGFIISADKTAILKFQDVNTKNDAEKLRGRSVFIPKSITESGKGSIRKQDFTGFELRNEIGLQTGVIKELIEIAKNPLFVTDINGVEVLVPANEELIIEINPGEKYICLRIPDGLIPQE